MQVTVHPTEMIPTALIDLSEENPNEQSDDEFSALVEEIIEHGWAQPVQVIGPHENGRYKMVGGAHRLKAAQVLEMKEVPGVVVPPEEWDDDVRKVQLVKQNILHGGLNPEKFTKLFNELARKYDAGIVQRMMGFTRQDAFEKVYQDARKALPPEMQDKLDDVRDEMKTVDDLSLVLNRLFTEYGNTLDSNFMFFTHGGRDHLMVQMKTLGVWQRMKKFAEWCVENEKEIDAEIAVRLDWPN